MKANTPMDPLSFFKKAKKVDVSHGFLESLRKDLVRHMVMYPAEQGEENAKPVAAGQSAPMRPFWRFAAVPVFIGFVAMFAVASTVFAAQGSLPGDPLYSIKLLSEQVELATTIMPLARSEARLAFAAKRVDEASKLARENAGEPSANNDSYHAAMQTALNDFNAQVAGAFAEARDLQEKNNASGSLAIAHDIEIATEAFKMTLASGTEKGGGAVAQSMDQFININSEFNNRANASLSNASGTSGPAVPPDSRDGGSENNSKKKSPRDAGGDLNGGQNNVSVHLPMPSIVPNSTDGKSGRDGNRGGGDLSGGESGRAGLAPQGVIVAPTPAPGLASSTEMIVTTSSISFASSSSPSSSGDSSLSSSLFPNASSDSFSNSSSGEQAHTDASRGEKSFGDSKNATSSANTDGKSGTEDKSKP